MNQPVTLRKTIDFTEVQVKQMEQVRLERKVTYNELMGSAWDAYLASLTAPHVDQLATSLESIQQRLWSLDSSSQKTAERLGALESLTQQTMELLLLLAESVDTSKGIPVEPERMPETPATDDDVGTDDVAQPTHSRWHIPEVQTPEPRKWYQRSRP